MEFKLRYLDTLLSATLKWFRSGLNRGPSACKADVMTTTLRNLNVAGWRFLWMFWSIIWALILFPGGKLQRMTPTWVEHATFWSGVRRATIAPRSLTSHELLDFFQFQLDNLVQQVDKWFRSGLNRGPYACEAYVITTTLRNRKTGAKLWRVQHQWQSNFMSYGI